MPAGRPTVYQDDFPERARASMKAGFSKSATAGSLGVCKATFDNWCKEHPEFLCAVKEGEMLRTLKLETDLLSAPDGPTVTSRIFALKNAAPDEWRDRKEIDHTTNGKDLPGAVDLSKAPPELLEWIVAQADAAKAE